MVDIRHSFAAERNLKFSTNVDIKKSKTKCIVFSKKKVNVNNLVPIYLDNVPLPYVDKLNHLGNMIQSDNSMKDDILIKRARFIGKVNSLNQEFYFSSPTVRRKLYNLYCCSFYGSNLWNLYNRQCDKLYISFNVSIRICFNIPRASHRYLIQDLIDYPHPKIMMCSRFVKFHKTISDCKKMSIRTIAKITFIDEKTVYKQNLIRIARECNTTIENLSPSLVKSEMEYFPIPESEAWRVPMMQNLLAIRATELQLENYDNREVMEMLHNVCTD